MQPALTNVLACCALVAATLLGACIADPPASGQPGLQAGDPGPAPKLYAEKRWEIVLDARATGSSVTVSSTPGRDASIPLTGHAARQWTAEANWTCLTPGPCGLGLRFAATDGSWDEVNGPSPLRLSVEGATERGHEYVAVHESPSGPAAVAVAARGVLRVWITEGSAIRA